MWDSVRETNSLQDLFSMQLCPPRESAQSPGKFVKQGGYMVRLLCNSHSYMSTLLSMFVVSVSRLLFNATANMSTLLSLDSVSVVSTQDFE